MASFLIATIACAVYANSLQNGFAYDDLHQLVDHDRIHTLTGTFDALDEPYWPGEEVGRLLGLWRPVTTLAYGIGWWAFDGQPFGFHLANVLLHAVLSVLVFFLCRRFVSYRGAVVAGLVFAVHPVHTEAVSNGVGVAELVSTAFVLVAVLLFLRWRSEGALDASDAVLPGRFGPVRIGVLCALFLLALLTKEGAIVLPALLVMLDWALSEATVASLLPYLRRRFALLSALTATAGLIFLMRWRVLGSIAAPEPPTGAEVLSDIPTIWTAAGVWPHYLRLLVFPLDLSADYAPGVIPVRFGWGIENLLGVVLVLAVMGISWAAWTRRRAGGVGDGTLSIGILWFVLTILPVSNLLFVSGVLLAERTLYLPSVGFVLGVGWCVDRVWTGPRNLAGALDRRVLVTVLAGVLGLFALRTVKRNPVWKNNDTLFTTLLLEHPESGRSHWVLASAFLAVGDFESAERGFLRAKRLFGWPGNLVLEFEAGEALMAGGRPRAAIPFLRDAIRLDSLYVDALRLLAVAHQDLEQWADAERMAARVLAIAEEDPGMHHLRATALEILRRPEEAIEHRVRAIELTGDPGWQMWVWLSSAEAAAGRGADACASLGFARARARGDRDRATVDSLQRLVAGCR